MATLNVTDYGAVGDGSSDDTSAINDAILDANPGDTVYLPAGTYLVNVRSGYSGNGNGAIQFHGPSGINDITFEGDGPGTVIEMEAGQSTTWGRCIIIEADGYSTEGLTLRNFVIEGNRGSHSFSENRAHVIATNDQEGAPAGVLFEDIHIQNGAGSGIFDRLDNTVYRRVTVENCWGHGIGLVGSQSHKRTIEQCLLDGQDKSGYHGIDANYGHVEIIDTVCINGGNGNGGTKWTTHTASLTVRRSRFSNNTNQGLGKRGSPRSPSTDVTLENVVMNGNSNDGFVTQEDADVTVPSGAEVVANNNADMGVNIIQESSIASDGAIYAFDNGQAAFGQDDSASGYVGLLDHNGNVEGGPISVQSTDSTRKDDISAVPTADEVGAWATSSTSDSGSSDQEEEDTSGTTSSVSGVSHLATAGGVIQTSGGVITTASSGPAPPDAVEDFESYAPGTVLTSTGPWSGAGSYDTNYEITDAAAATGGQSIVLTDSSNYNAIQSMPGDGLGTYPSADCTIRMASYIDGGNVDIGFGVPDGETNYDNNCYRLMGGPGTSGTPRLTRTIDYDMETLASLDNSFPTGTWLDHVIEFESTGSEVVITYTGYAWDTTNSEWTQFESATQAVDSDATFADGSGLGIGGFRAGTNGLRHDNLRIEAPGNNGSPTWTPVTENP